MKQQQYSTRIAGRKMPYRAYAGDDNAKPLRYPAFRSTFTSHVMSASIRDETAKQVAETLKEKLQHPRSSVAAPCGAKKSKRKVNLGAQQQQPLLRERRQIAAEIPPVGAYNLDKLSMAYNMHRSLHATANASSSVPQRQKDMFVTSSGTGTNLGPGAYNVPIQSSNRQYSKLRKLPTRKPKSPPKPLKISLMATSSSLSSLNSKSTTTVASPPIEKFQSNSCDPCPQSQIEEDCALSSLVTIQSKSVNNSIQKHSKKSFSFHKSARQTWVDHAVEKVSDNLGSDTLNDGGVKKLPNFVSGKAAAIQTTIITE